MDSEANIESFSIEVVDLFSKIHGLSNLGLSDN
jgi:hypothetical protein